LTYKWSYWNLYQEGRFPVLSSGSALFPMNALSVLPRAPLASLALTPELKALVRQSVAPSTFQAYSKAWERLAA